ncbi:MAG: hypothetical protein M3Q94_18075 [Pseudomonadota bacterium]|nr:hypothetical protein [Pseudomonadota bacterium]
MTKIRGSPASFIIEHERYVQINVYIADEQGDACDQIQFNGCNRSGR